MALSVAILVSKMASEMFDDLRLLGTLLQSVSDEGGIIHRNYETRSDIFEEKREGIFSFFLCRFKFSNCRSPVNTQHLKTLVY